MKSLWQDAHVRGKGALDVLVYTSRLIGMNPGLVLWGGGNSSVKVEEKDHTGNLCRILMMKGSGSDMKTISPHQFTPLRLDELLLLLKRESMTDEEMVDYQLRCVIKPGAPKPSIETLLHAFLPQTHIYHTHADAICALTDTPNAQRHINAVYGKDVALVPYYRPGFLLSKATAVAYSSRPGLRAIILNKHGLITWGKSAKQAYLETIRMVTEAQGYLASKAKKRSRMRKPGPGILAQKRRAVFSADVAPILRGEVSRGRRMVLMFDDDRMVMEFVNHPAAKRWSQVGPFTPDHLLHTKPWPLWLEINLHHSKGIHSVLSKTVEAYRRRYAAYFERYKTPGVKMLDPNPRVILIPGIGMFTTGKDLRACQITHDLYRHTIDVIQQSSAIDTYQSLLPKELCDFEYWPLENFKLTLLPAEKELSRCIALVTGAAGGIGRAISIRLVEAGAMVVLSDIDFPRVEKVASDINRISGGTSAKALQMDVSSESSVRRGFKNVVLEFGGLDILVSNAGVARTSPVESMLLSDWNDSMSVNATGHFLICREATRVFRQQGIGGNIVVVASKNVFSPGKDFGAYSASKAAQVQLSRILAIEGGRDRIRVNMINPDGIFESSGLWSSRIRKERARAHGIDTRQLEDFYIQRNLLKSPILPDDVAEAVLFFASDRSAKTTGAVLPVDGGLRDAFPR